MPKNVREIGIIMNGVTGRMGTNQHLMRSIVAIIAQGGLSAGEGDVIMPRPVLVGRNPDKLRRLVELSGIEKWTTDVDEALADPDNLIYFDSQTTSRRFDAVARAIRAGKHVYCEKPIAMTAQRGIELYHLATGAGVKNGVVQDKLWLPGLLKLKKLRDEGFFGRILEVRGDFGYWVFEGDRGEAQRPSWNYRSEDGGGIIFDMFCHWQYVLDNLFGEVRAVSCLGATHIPKRWDEQGQPYDCTADAAAYATFELEGGIIAQFNSSWVTRVRRDDLLTIQVNGTEGSAVAGLRRCWTQSYDRTPRPVWNPDVDSPIDFYADWDEVDAGREYDNAFKAQWELFLHHVVSDTPWTWNLLQGAKGVQLAETAMESWHSRAWTNVPDLAAET